MRTRIISDLHLGHGSTRLEEAAMLDPVLEEVDRLVLAGDVWQQWQWDSGHRKGERQVRELAARAEKRGIALEVLRGNHDPDGGKGVVWLAERRVLVTHGDAIYDLATPWSRQLRAYRMEVEKIIADYADRTSSAEACADRACAIAKVISGAALPKLRPPFNFFATAFWPPGRLFEILRVWHGMGEAGLDFLARSGGGSRVLVCGHFHRPGIWERNGRVMINTGSFMRGSRPWAVDLSGEKMTARVLDRVDGGFRPGEVKGRWHLSRQG